MMRWLLAFAIIAVIVAVWGIGWLLDARGVKSAWRLLNWCVGALILVVLFNLGR
jgi:hypothetical protein